MTHMSRRTMVRGSLAAVAVGTAGRQLLLPPSAGAATTATYLPYTADSYFRTPVTGIAVDNTRTTAFRSFMSTHPDQSRTAYPLIKGVTGNSWGTPFAVGTASDPVWKVRNLAGASSRNRVLQTTGFHAPAWLSQVVTGTSDSPLCVFDTVNRVTVFLTKVSPAGTNLLDVAGSGGVTYHASNGLDGRNPRANDARNFTSRGRISDAMVIRQDLVAKGVANNTDLGHVLHMFIVESKTADGFRHPMVGAESGKAGFGAEGERLAIAPTVNLATRGLSPEGLVIARTLQRYGCYIGDNAGSGSSLKAEQETTARPVWGGRLSSSSLKGITWSDFVVLKG